MTRHPSDSDLDRFSASLRAWGLRLLFSHGFSVAPLVWDLKFGTLRRVYSATSASRPNEPRFFSSCVRTLDMAGFSWLHWIFDSVTNRDCRNTFVFRLALSQTSTSSHRKLSSADYIFPCYLCPFSVGLLKSPDVAKHRGDNFSMSIQLQPDKLLCNRFHLS
jgi:hypothetical protein